MAEALGDQAAVSRSTVSAICQAIKDEYQAWARRRLDAVTLDYLFLDASFFRMHPGCLTLVWAVLDRASRGWRGLTMTSDGLRLLQDLRRSLLQPPRQLRPPTVTAAHPSGARQFCR